jgi:hypothetical protein
LIVMGVPSLPAASGVPLLAGGSVHSSSHVHGHTVDSSVHALGRGGLVVDRSVASSASAVVASSRQFSS